MAQQLFQPFLAIEKHNFSLWFNVW